MISESPHEMKRKTVLLEALCLLSFAGSTIGLLLYLLAALFFDDAAGLISHLSSPQQTAELSPLYFSLLGGFHLLSLWGVYRMWNLRRTGFFLYTLAQTAIYLLPLLWLGKEAFSSAITIFTLLFITGYAISFLHLRGHSLENSRTLSR